jgi:PAS domain S-box-containing protein
MRDSNDGPHPAPAAQALGAMLRASDGILDILPVATFVCDARGTILQYNRRAVEIWGEEPRPGQRHEDFTRGARYCEIDGTPLKRSMLAEVLASGTPLRDAELQVVRMDGRRVFVSVNIDPLRDAQGKLVGAVNCFLDITERHHINAALEASRLRAREQEQRLAATYEHAAIGISEVAPDGRFLRVNEAITAITGFSRAHLLANRLYTHTHPDDADADRDAFRKQVAGTLDFYSVEKRFVRKDGRVIWISVSSSPVRDESGRLLYLVRVVQDITERKAAEQRAKLLIDELNHRVKNTLATVQSLASQTARAAPTPASFRESFEGRLVALSKAHDQLTMHHWESADLRELLSAGFAPYHGGAERVVMRGEDVVLRPRAALTLAMTFHELITNAAKYGALSAPGGGVEMRWQIVEADGMPTLHVEWREQGGPPVAPPARRSFGTRLIESGVKAELGGRVEIAFASEGLRCDLDIPLASLAVKAGEG